MLLITQCVIRWQQTLLYLREIVSTVFQKSFRFRLPVCECVCVCVCVFTCTEDFTCLCFELYDHTFFALWDPHFQILCFHKYIQICPSLLFLFRKGNKSVTEILKHFKLGWIVSPAKDSLSSILANSSLYP